MGTDHMKLIKMLQYIEYIIVGIVVYLYFSFVFPILPGLDYFGIHAQGATAFIVLISTLSAVLYINFIAIRRLRVKGR